MAFSPAKNLLVWVDSGGDLTRWRDPIPASGIDPVKASMGTSAVSIPVKRKGTPTLFDMDADVVASAGRTETGKAKVIDLEDDLGVDIDNDDWILDDVGAMDEDDGEARRLAAEGGVREMGKLPLSFTAPNTDQYVK